MIKSQIDLQKLKQEQQAALLNAVFETQESERKRLAEDLHDSVGQVLSVIKLNLHRLDKACGKEARVLSLLEDTRKLTEACFLEIRHIIHNIMPPVLTDFGLIEALEDLCGRVGKSTGIRVEFYCSVEKERYKPETEVMLYRVIQELFNNAVKHSGATAIQLQVFRKGNCLHLTFEDNGKGFNREEVKGGFGLQNLQSRVAFLKGSLQINTAPQKGTEVKLKVNLSDLK